MFLLGISRTARAKVQPNHLSHETPEKGSGIPSYPVANKPVELPRVALHVVGHALVVGAHPRLREKLREMTEIIVVDVVVVAAAGGQGCRKEWMMKLFIIR